MKKQILSLFTAAVLFVAAVPVVKVRGAVEFRHPDGKDPGDLAALTALLEEQHSKGFEMTFFNDLVFTDYYRWDDDGRLIYFNISEARQHPLTGDLDLSPFDKLKHIGVSGNDLTSLNVSGCPVLESLTFSGNQITSIDLSKNTKLELLWCVNTPLTSLDVSANTKLSSLWCIDTQITSLDLSKNPDMSTLRCEENQLTSLDLTNNPNLDFLTCSDSNLKSIELGEKTGMKYIYCDNNQLTSLDVSGCADLEMLKCDGNMIASVTDITGLTDGMLQDINSPTKTDSGRLRYYNQNLPFRKGDLDGDAKVTIDDAVEILMFLGGLSNCKINDPEVGEKALNAALLVGEDAPTVDDAIFILMYLGKLIKGF